MAKKITKPEPPSGEQPKKKKKKLFKLGDFVKNVEDPSIIVLVTKDAEKGVSSFHGTCVAADKRQVGEHERFWLKNRFELTKVKICVE